MVQTILQKEAKIIKSVNFNKKKWNKLFDKKTCNILNQYWRLIYKIYNKNKVIKNFLFLNSFLILIYIHIIS